MRTVNFTITLEDDQEVLNFENWLKQYVEIKDIIILPDTKDLYENDTHFKKLTKAYYHARKLRDDYINEKLYGN